MQASVGIDLGGTKIEGIVLGENNEVLERRRIATERERGYDHIVESVAGLIERLRLVAPKCDVIGIGTPGAVTRAGTIKNSNTTCLNGRTLPADLQRRLGLEIRFENDANCFALAEAQLGAGRGAALMFGVILGTGVGGGIVHRGELLRGPQHLSGEWGHHSIDPNGPDCYCGHRGCVETFLSGPALSKVYEKRAGASRSPAEIEAAAQQGDDVARLVMSEYLDRFGRAVANLVDILDPDAIVLGGGLSNLDCLYREGRAAVERYVFNEELRTPLVRNEMGDAAGVYGAALIARDGATDGG